mgnify:FL=1
MYRTGKVRPDFGMLHCIREEGNMNTTDKIINELAVKIANLAVEVANYKVLYNEALEDNGRLSQELERVNNVLESDEALKELFEEVAQKLGKE